MKLPKPKYWFSAQSAPVAVQSALALMIGVVSIYAAVPLSIVLILGGITVVAVVWSWWGSAKTIEAAVLRDDTIDRVVESLNELIGRQPTEAEVPKFVEETRKGEIWWQSSLKEVLTLPQWHAVFNSRPEAKIPNFSSINDEHRRALSWLHHYRAQLAELALRGG